MSFKQTFCLRVYQIPTTYLRDFFDFFFANLTHNLYNYASMFCLCVMTKYVASYELYYYVRGCKIESPRYCCSALDSPPEPLVCLYLSNSFIA